MKTTLTCLLIGASAAAYAGGTIGGSPGLSKEDWALSLASTAFDVKSLPKMYIDQDSFRRTSARLSVGDIDTASLIISGNEIQVRKLKGSIVDSSISTEYLPD